MVRWLQQWGHVILSYDVINGVTWPSVVTSQPWQPLSWPSSNQPRLLDSIWQPSRSPCVQNKNEYLFWVANGIRVANAVCRTILCGCILGEQMPKHGIKCVATRYYLGQSTCCCVTASSDSICWVSCYQAAPLDPGSKLNSKTISQLRFAYTVTIFGIGREGQALPSNAKYHGCRIKTVSTRNFGK